MTNTNKPLVSVIITTYHNEEYLPRAIECVLNQTYSPIEVIVVDDNPPESESRKKTTLVMNNYPSVIYLCHPENRNGAAARNTGIQAATGKYLAFLDNDDIYFSNHIEKCVDVLEEHPECGCALSSVIKIQNGLCWDIIPPIKDDPRTTLLLHEAALGTGSNLFVRADAVRQIEGFDERFMRHQDVEFGIRLFSKYPPAYLEDIDIVKEMDGFSNVPDFCRFLSIKEFFWSVFENEINDLGEIKKAQYYAGQYGSLLYTACKSGNTAHIKMILNELKSYRSLQFKEYFLLLLSALHLFPFYEQLKKLTKKINSPKLYNKVTRSLSEHDLTVFQNALSKK